MELTEMQLDALREMANIGSGQRRHGAGRHARPSGRPERPVGGRAAAGRRRRCGRRRGRAVTAVALPVFGDIDATVLLTFQPEHAATLCGFLGVGRRPRDGAVGAAARSATSSARRTSTPWARCAAWRWSRRRRSPPATCSARSCRRVLAPVAARQRRGAAARLGDDTSRARSASSGSCSSPAQTAWPRCSAGSDCGARRREPAARSNGGDGRVRHRRRRAGLPRPGLVHRRSRCSRPRTAWRRWRTSCCPPADGRRDGRLGRQVRGHRGAGADRRDDAAWARAARRWRGHGRRRADVRAGRRQRHGHRRAQRRGGARGARRAPASRCVASMTGGSVGRTMRVYVGSRRVTYREAGGDEIDLLITADGVAA